MSELANIARQHTTFADPNGKVTGIPMTGKKVKPSETVHITKDIMFKTKQSFTSPSTTLGVDHVFTVFRADQYVSNFWLEITGTGAAVYDIGNLGGYSCINRVQISQGDEIMMTYTGEDLAKLVHLINRSNPDALAELATLSRSTADTDVTPMIIPILAPGSNLLFSADAYNAASPAWPIGACSSDMIITVTLNTGAYISKTNAFQLASLKLKYYKYVDKNPVNNQFQKNKGADSTGVYYSWFYMRPISGNETAVLVANTDYTFKTDNIIVEGEVDAIVMDVVTTGAGSKEEDMEYFDKAIINKLEFRSGDALIYAHENQYEARYLSLKDWRCINKLAGSATDLGYIYAMGVSEDPFASVISGNIKGSVNFNINKPTYILQVLANATYRIRYMAIYKCFYEIKLGGNGGKKMIPYTN